MYSHSIPIIESPPGHGWDSKGEGGSHLGAMAAKMAAKWWWNNSEHGGKMVGSSKENGGLTCLKQRTWELEYQNMGKLSVLQQPWIALMLFFFLLLVDECKGHWQPPGKWWQRYTKMRRWVNIFYNYHFPHEIIFNNCLQHIFLFNELEDLCWEFHVSNWRWTNIQSSPSPSGAKDPTHLGAELSRVFGVRQRPEIRVVDI